MDASKTNLFKLVDGNKQFQIPIYQRTYSWRPEQCARLLADVLTIANAKNGYSHFIGSIVYVADGNYMADGVTPVLVIDGQQRLTTLSLMILALRKVASDGADIGIEPGCLANFYLFNSNEKEGSDEHIKLRLTRSDKETYRKLCFDLPLPKEWFLAPLFIIDEAVGRIKDGTITGYVYDPKAAKLSLASAHDR
jgi:uncharacterized protein with ParB-like and HNH nuclease domain